MNRDEVREKATEAAAESWNNPDLNPSDAIAAGCMVVYDALMQRRDYPTPCDADATRIADLEKQLHDANARIGHLEADKAELQQKLAETNMLADKYVGQMASKMAKMREAAFQTSAERDNLQMALDEVNECYAAVCKERDQLKEELAVQRGLAAAGRIAEGKPITFQVGDKVVKNPDKWKPSEFDAWGCGEGIGVVGAVCKDGTILILWPNGKAWSLASEVRRIET